MDLPKRPFTHSSLQRGEQLGVPSFVRGKAQRFTQRVAFRIQQGGDVLCLRLMPMITGEWESLHDRLRLIHSNAEIVNQRDVIVKRARQCERERRMKPNILAVDFAGIGDVVGAARELNGLR